VHAGLRLRGGSARSHRLSAPPGDANCTGLQQYGAERPMLQAYYDVDGTVNFAAVYPGTCLRVPCGRHTKSCETSNVAPMERHSELLLVSQDSLIHMHTYKRGSCTTVPWHTAAGGLCVRCQTSDSG
jgi:hypothetical protein